jgi:diguanylate cyclase (GGDEF)-like protein/PAS domain S-box-containing protein
MPLRQPLVAALAPGLALAGGLLFTGALFALAMDDAVDSETDRFLLEAQRIKDAVVLKLNETDDILNGMRLVFNASAFVDADEFLVMSRDVLRKEHAITSMMYMPLVPGNAREAFEAERHDAGLVTFGITEYRDGRLRPAAPRQRYFPIHYLEPLTPLTARNLGLDLLADTDYASYILNAIETGASNAVQQGDTTAASNGQVVLSAVYAGKQIPVTPEARQRLVSGLVAVRVDYHRMLADIPFDDDDLVFRLEMVSALDPGTVLLHLHDVAAGGTVPAQGWLEPLTFEHRLAVGDQRFTIRLQKPLALADLDSTTLAGAAALGLVLTFLLWALTRSVKARTEDLLRRNVEIGELVEQRTRELGEARHHAQITLESIADGVISTDADGRVLYMNPIAERMTGRSSDAVLGWPIETVFSIRDEQTGRRLENPVLQCLSRGAPVSSDLAAVLVRHDARSVPVDVSAAPIRERGGRIGGAVLAFHDVGETRRLTMEMAHQATHDALTSLPNRVLLMEKLAHRIDTTGMHGRRFAVLFMDIDRFKVINDTLGHNVGDELLRQSAERFRDCVRDDDMVSRLGGDEFVVLLSDVASNSDALDVADKLCKSLHKPFLLDGKEIFASTSIGICVYPDGGRYPDELLKNADVAMYESKAHGRNRAMVYSAEMNAGNQHRLELESELRRAVERDELLLHYQPQVDPSCQRVVGMEALLRWQHPTRGLLAPGEFLAVAEETGLIVDIGRWVLHEACRQNRAWQEQGLASMRVAVNIAHRQFHRQGLADEIAEVLAATGLEPDCLELELTEGILAEDSEAATRRLERLRAMGVHLAIDDFGTGYSSLAYLKRFPIQTLKIDQVFVRDITSDPSDAEICAAVIAMAHNLNLKVVAEGVEDAAQLEALLERDCDLIQGYFFGRPVAAEALPALVDRIHAAGVVASHVPAQTRQGKLMF